MNLCNVPTGINMQKPAIPFFEDACADWHQYAMLHEL